MRRSPHKSSVLFVAAARNCEKSVQRTIMTVEDCFSDFAKREWIIVESDSTDKTLNILEELKSKFSINTISMGNLCDHYPLRTERLAVCRNRYLDEIRTNDEYLCYDFVVVLDMDGVNFGLTKNAVASCWEAEFDWDVCFANQLAPYYDIWALRHDRWMPHDCFKEVEFLAGIVGRKEAVKKAIHTRMLTIDCTRPAIQVSSAFGGLGIYKRKVITSSRYVGLSATGTETCEHVSFHKELQAQGFSLFIIPSLINGAWNEHSIQSSSVRRFVWSLRRRIGALFLLFKS